MSLHSKLNESIKSKTESDLIFPEKQTCFSEKSMAVFHASSNQLMIFFTWQKVNCWPWLLTTRIWWAEIVKNCRPVWIVLLFNFEFFKTTSWISHIEVFLSNIAFVEDLSQTAFWEKFHIYMKFSWPRKWEGAKIFVFSSELDSVKPFVLQH